MNALGIARRELDLVTRCYLRKNGSRSSRPRSAGAERTPVLLDELKAHVAEKLRISNPAYLEKYE